jgi:hypothetical protein
MTWYRAKYLLIFSGLLSINAGYNWIILTPELSAAPLEKISFATSALNSLPGKSSGNLFTPARIRLDEKTKDSTTTSVASKAPVRLLAIVQRGMQREAVFYSNERVAVKEGDNVPDLGVVIRILQRHVEVQQNGSTHTFEIFPIPEHR